MIIFECDTIKHIITTTTKSLVDLVAYLALKLLSFPDSMKFPYSEEIPIIWTSLVHAWLGCTILNFPFQ